jgi:branched-chain amino acid transport system permease protein
MARRDLTKWVGLGILVLLLLSAPLIIQGAYHQHILILIFVNSICALGVLLILTTGQLTLGHAGFMAIGAYASALMTMKLGISFWLALPLAGVISGGIGAIAGWVMLRARGGAFLLLTWAFAEVIRLTIRYWPSLLGGMSGITNIPRPDAIFGIEFSTKVPYYYLALFLLAVTVYVFYRVDRSKFGLVFRSIALNPSLAQSVGVNLMRYKVYAFAMACFFAGIAGSFYAHYIVFLSPQYFTVWKSLIFQMYIIVGGIGFIIAGPIAGTAFLIVIPEFLRMSETYSFILYGAIFILVIFFLPGGILSLPQQVKVWRRKMLKLPERVRIWQYLKPGS